MPKVNREVTVSEGCPETVAGLDLSKPALLEASAGTGKTYAIEHLVLRLLIESDKLELPQILLLTFSEKAAGELKEKIRNRLAWRIGRGGLPPAILDRLKEALLNFDRAAIYTIHGFCHRILRKYAFENNALFRTELVKRNEDLIDEVLTEEMRSTWLSECGEGPEGLTAFRSMAKALRMDDSSTWKSKILDIARNFNPLRGDQVLPAYDPALIESLEGEILAAFLEIAGMLPDLISGREAEHAFARRYRTVKFANTTVRKKAPQMLEAALLTAALCRSISEGRAAGDAKAAALEFQALKKSVGFRAVDETGFIAAMMPKAEECPAWPWPELEKILGLLETARLAALKLKTENEAQPFSVQRRVILDLREKTRAHKKAKGLITFDDMIEDVCVALREKPERVDMLRKDYRYCLVDEFQDTDPLQWEIFRDVFLKAGSANPLYLIGDPKQAIYRFRGGDIHTYMEARKDLFALSRAGLAQGRGLETNFRSSRGMIEACNAVFAHGDWFHTLAVDPGDPLWRLPAEPDPLGYVPVGFGGLAVQQARDATYLPFPMVLMDFTGNRQGTSPGDPRATQPAEPKKPELKRSVNAWIAAEIRNLMSDPDRLMVPDRGTGVLRPLSWGDICVLLKTHKEKSQLERTLLQAGIPVQIEKRAGLYKGEAAGHFLAVLEALEEPGHAGKLARALLSRFFRAAGDAAPASLPGNPHPLFEDWSRMAAHRRWQRLFQSLLYQTGLLYRESLEADGDRRIMDFLHLGQNLVQEALGRNLDLPALVQHLRESRSSPGGADESQDLHREESEGGKTVLMTMHTSKGLEFPVVFLACFSAGRSQSYFKYRDGLHTVYNLDTRNDKARKAFEEESESEERRLFYVAMTRARYKLFVPILPKRTGRGAFGPLGGFVADALLTASVARPDHIKWIAAEDHARNARQAPSLTAVASAATDATLALSRPAAPLSDSALAALLSDYPREDRLSLPSADFSKRRRRLASYSHLVRNSHGLATEDVEGRFDKEEAPLASETSGDQEDRDDREGQASASETQTAPASPAFPGNAVPRGRETGNMFHGILENIDFALAAKAASPEAMLAHPPTLDLILSRMAEYRLDEAHLAGIAGVLWNTLATLVPDPAGEAPFRLGEIAERRAEMEFLFPYGKAGQGPDGYLWGFIDLVFRYHGRYYLLDWKSNHLDGYGKPDLEKSVRESHYDLQYMLYSLALEKWLRSLIPDYDHGRHFGGVLYVYLRGMVAAPVSDAPTGIHALRPTPEQMLHDYPIHLSKAMAGASGGKPMDPALLLGREGPGRVPVGRGTVPA